MPVKVMVSYNNKQKQCNLKWYNDRNVAYHLHSNDMRSAQFMHFYSLYLNVGVCHDDKFIIMVAVVGVVKENLEKKQQKSQSYYPLPVS